MIGIIFYYENHKTTKHLIIIKWKIMIELKIQCVYSFVNEIRGTLVGNSGSMGNINMLTSTNHV